MTKCKYDVVQCKNNAIESGYCIFHDQEYYKTHHDEIDDAFKKKLVGSIEKNVSLNCEGYHLVNVDCCDITFKNNVNFNNAKFHGTASFSGAHFEGKETDFTEAKFSGEGGAIFSYAEFSGEGGVYFLDAEFSGKIGVYFTRAKFSGEGEAIFSGAEFSGKKGVYFSGAEFSGKKGVDFSGAGFSGEGIANFSNAEFSGEGSADFSGAEFSGGEGVDFSGAKFSGEEGAYFSGTKFSGEGGANFHSTEFLQKTSFLESKFHCKGLINFVNVKSEREINFNKSYFKGKADFSNADFKDDTRFLNVTFEKHVDFKNVFFKNPRDVYFDVEKIDNISFLGTDISNVRFGVEFKKALKKSDYKIYEERVIRNKLDKDIPLSAVLALYRNLRENFEYNMEYEEAGQFFVREMNLKRIYRPTKPIKKRNWFSRNFFATGLYYWTAKYGEDFKRPFLITAVAVSLSAIYFFISGAEETIWDSLVRSSGAFTPSFDFPDNSTPIDYALKVIFFPIAATLFIAIRRKLERRFRH